MVRSSVCKYGAVMPNQLVVEILMFAPAVSVAAAVVALIWAFSDARNRKGL
jgi:hypothetical protein